MSMQFANGLVVVNDTTDDVFGIDASGGPNGRGTTLIHS